MGMGMEISSSVIEHGFDKEMLEQIGSLRMIRLNLAEQMLSNLDETMRQLDARGLAEVSDRNELRDELKDRIKTMRERMARPDVVYTDEIDLYADMLESSEAAD